MTTDITELAQSLKAAAEKASGSIWTSDGGGGVWSDSGTNNGFFVAECEGSDWEDNSHFIALANPANIIALVEAKEKAQRANNSAPAILRQLAEEKKRRGEVAAATAFNYAASALQKELSK